MVGLACWAKYWRDLRGNHKTLNRRLLKETLVGYRRIWKEESEPQTVLFSNLGSRDPPLAEPEVDC